MKSYDFFWDKKISAEKMVLKVEEEIAW